MCAWGGVNDERQRSKTATRTFLQNAAPAKGFGRFFQRTDFRGTDFHRTDTHAHDCRLVACRV